MATITLRIPDELKNSMEGLDEVNWSAVTRNLLQEKVNELYVLHRYNKAEKEITDGKTVTHEKVKKMFLR